MFVIHRVDAVYSDSYRKERNISPDAIATCWACQSLAEAHKIHDRLKGDPAFESVTIVTNQYGV